MSTVVKQRYRKARRWSATTVLGLTFGAPLAAGAAWIAYSKLLVDHRRNLRPAVPGDRRGVKTPAGEVCLYGATNGEGSPLLLVHSINAAASSYEMRPIYNHYLGSRPVYALDLPGFGFSERRAQVYTPRMMTDAICAAVADIRSRHDGVPVDLMALSVSCEYAARAAIERPHDFRSLALISPTGFDKVLSGYGRAQSTKGSKLRLAIVSVPLWSQALFDLVVSRPSMRFFLRKTFGSKKVDQGLFDYDQATAHQPDARHVVWSFLSGYLFSDDVTRVYKVLRLPVWTCHGRRGDFVDFRKELEVASHSNWHFTEFDTGAMPQFEKIDQLTSAIDEFSDSIN